MVIYWIVPDWKGLDILPYIDVRLTIPLIIMTNNRDQNLDVEIMKSGAIDYVFKSTMIFRDYLILPGFRLVTGRISGREGRLEREFLEILADIR